VLRSIIVLIVNLVQVMLVWSIIICGNCETGASDVSVVGGNIVVIVKLVQLILSWWAAILW